jgi:hypothetical protein
MIPELELSWISACPRELDVVNSSDAYNSFGSFARPESSSIQRQVLPQQQDSVISVRGHTWIDKDSNARKSSGASPRSTTVNDVQQNWRLEK